MHMTWELQKPCARTRQNASFSVWMVMTSALIKVQSKRGLRQEAKQEARLKRAVRLKRALNGLSRPLSNGRGAH